MFPDDERRMAELELRVSACLASVDESMRAVSKFSEMVDSGESLSSGLVLMPVDDEDSLVTCIDSIVRTVA